MDYLHTRRWSVIAAVFVLAAGVLAGLYVHPREQAARLQALLVDAQRCAVAFRSDQVARLSGTRADLTSQDYQEVKSLLVRLHEIDSRVRFAYLMRRVPETPEVIFLADSEAPSSSEISLPGDEYPEAATSPGLQRILRTGLPSTEGPLDDSFGTWVTGYAPVRTDEAGNVIDLVGLDIDADRWSRELWLATGLSAGAVWFALGLPLVIFEAMRRQLRLTSTIRRLSLALDQSNVAVVIADSQGILEYVNLGFCRQLGYTREEAVGRSWQALGMQAMEPAQLDEMKQEFRRGRSWHGQWETRRRNGEIYPVRGGVSPVREPGANRTCYVAVFDDISELVRAGAELRAAKQQAEAGSAAKSQFLAMMSHEIRTPLNGVIGMTSLLRQSPLNPAQEESVRIIESSGEALLGIIDDILNLTKIEAGKLELRSSPFVVADVVGEVVRLLQPTAAAKGILLRQTIETQIPPTVVGDAGRLRQVLMNLVGNGMKFTEKGEVNVQARIETTTDPRRGRLWVSVRDTGPGIPPERQQELFVPFAQLDTSIARRFGGTGLGLVISRRLCEAMGGSIAVESDGRTGSTFTFHIEVGLLAETREIAPSAATATSASDAITTDSSVAEIEIAGSTQPSRSLRVLLVEDNPVNALVARRMLTTLGYRSDEARTGHEAIAACQQRSYDVILMDLQMPELDGLAATRVIRALPLPISPWIIAVTAEAMDGDRERCLAGGMDGYLSKPLTLHRLAEQLADVRERVG